MIASPATFPLAAPTYACEVQIMNISRLMIYEESNKFSSVIKKQSINPRLLETRSMIMKRQNQEHIQIHIGRIDRLDRKNSNKGFTHRSSPSLWHRTHTFSWPSIWESACISFNKLPLSHFSANSEVKTAPCSFVP